MVGQVSTRSRLKAAGVKSEHYLPSSVVSTRSRLKAAGTTVIEQLLAETVSTRSRLKAAGSINQHFIRT